MAKQFDRRSLKLTPGEWQYLEELADATNSTAPTGTTAGEPSWRSLIKRIARNEIQLKWNVEETNDVQIRVS